VTVPDRLPGSRWAREAGRACICGADCIAGGLAGVKSSGGARRVLHMTRVISEAHRRGAGAGGGTSPALEQRIGVASMPCWEEAGLGAR
jgi:hypothetical protein